MTSDNLVALVFGSSGVSGWGLAQELANWSSPTPFSKIILLTFQPTSAEESRFPEDERILIHSGIDLNQSEDQVGQSLKQVPGIDTVTHVFYNACGMAPSYDFTKSARMNVTMTKNAVAALAATAPRVKHVSFQSGSIVYGIPFASLLGWAFKKGPFKETYPRISAPFGTMISAYGQEDAVKAQAAKHSWTWTAIRADTIVGFAPKPNPHCLAVSLGTYFAFYRHLYGPGADVPFPGNAKSWQSRFTLVGQRHLARFNIRSALQASSLTPSQLNISDGGAPSCWQELWPKAAAYFGLIGSEVGSGRAARFGPKWFESVKDAAEEYENEKGLKKGFVTELPWQYLEFIVGLKVERVLDVERAKSTGFEEVSDTFVAFTETWDLMKAARMIPAE